MIGVLLPDTGPPFYEQVEQGLRVEAAGRQFELEVVTCDGSAGKQGSRLEQLVEAKVAAIVAAPCDGTAIVPQLAAARRAGIPVVTVETPAAGGETVSHVATGGAEIGSAAALTLANLISGRGEPAEAQVLIIDDSRRPEVDGWVMAFQQYMNMSPGTAILDRPSADGQRARAMALTRTILQSHPGLKGIFAVDDESGMGAVAALEAAGRTDVVVVAFGGSPEAQEAVRRGSPLKALVVRQPIVLGRTALKAVAEHLTGIEIQPSINVGVTVVTPSAIKGP